MIPGFILGQTKAGCFAKLALWFLTPHLPFQLPDCRVGSRGKGLFHVVLEVICMGASQMMGIKSFYRLEQKALGAKGCGEQGRGSAASSCCPAAAVGAEH